MTNNIEKYNNLFKDKYKVIKKIGSGSFGEVYLAFSQDDNIYVAIKIEDKYSQSRIRVEYEIYNYLYFAKQCKNIPKIYHYIETIDSRTLIMELLGPSLDQVFEKYNKKFKLGTVFKIAIDIINIMYDVHKSTIIHRDIKPNNFLLDIDKKEIYIMDFGLAKKFYSKKKHISISYDRSLIGTARYASINMHMGLEPSRRDDLESIGYMLIYFAKGVLPWQGLKKKQGVNPVKLIGEKKMCTPLSVLCKDLPPCFEKYLNSCKNLGFTETPDYRYLIDIFLEDADNLNIPIKFEWNL